MSIVVLAAVVVAGVSCLQLEQPGMVDSSFGDGIVFEVKSYTTAQTKAAEVMQSFGDGIMVTTSSMSMPDPFVADGTKASAVTSLSSFYVSAVTGSAGSESSAFNSTQFTQVPGSSPAVYKGSKFWPASNQNYKCYASSRPLTFAAAGTTVSATNTTDVICAYLTSSTYKEKNTLSFEHIFARIGNVTVSADAPYTISNVNISITPKTGGTYNLRTGAWSSTTDGSSTTIASAIGSNSNDLYLVPGTYQLTASWTATKGSYREDFSNKTVNITLVEGKVNNITCILSGNNVIRPIGVYTVNRYSRKTVGFAPGNLQCTIASGPTNSYNYTGTDWRFASSQWEYGGGSFTIGNKMELFGWVGASARYDTYGLCSLTIHLSDYFGGSYSEALKTDWGNIPGVISACGDGWFTLSKYEWYCVIYERSTGVTVNGTSDARYTQATIRTDVSRVKGLILFPDDYSAGTPAGVTWGTINAASDWSTQCTAAGWASLEAAGCVFLPAAGSRSSSSGSSVGGYDGCYWSSSPESYEYASALFFYSSYVNPQTYSNDRYKGYSVRLAKLLN